MKFFASSRLALALAFVVCGCSADPPVASPGDAGPTCASDDDCEDGLFCSGPAVCLPGGPSSDSRGCVVLAGGPCLVGQTCDEARDGCVTDCAVVRDADGDGADALECGGRDCDDSDSSRYPGSAEVCDADDVDEDCDPSTFGFRDADDDGSPDARCCNGTACGTDCDDTAPGRNPTVPEVCDSLDNDCDGAVDEGILGMFYPDLDMDGAGDRDAEPVLGCGGSGGLVDNAFDCDDTNGASNPGATEICDSVDNDCDGSVDEMAVEIPWFVDADADGYGDDAQPTVLSCVAVPGYAVRGTDCDDTRAFIHPFAPELCDAIDDNCGIGGVADPAEDVDGDGHSAPAAACSGGYPKDDCDDAVSFVYAGAPELCDGLDDDCSSGGGVDASEDADGDLHAPSGASCAGGYPTDDCDDARGTVRPGAAEICDARDSDCSSGGDAQPAEDADGDGHAAASAPCTGGYAKDDCDDTSATVYRDAPELCDLLDTDCRSGGGAATAEDRDGDGFSGRSAACSGGFARNDCDDTNVSVNVLGIEACNGVDDDCDGSTDEACLRDVIPSASGRTNSGVFQGTSTSSPTASVVCPAGMFVTGFEGHGASGSITRYTLACRDFVASASPPLVTAGTGTSAPTYVVGGVSSLQYSMSCPANTMLTGTHLATTTSDFSCRPVVVTGDIGAYTASLGAEQGSIVTSQTFRELACPTDQVVVGIAFAVSTTLTAPRFVCAPLEVVTL